MFKEIMATRFCSPPLLIDDIVVEDDHKDVQNSTQIEKSHHL